MSDPGLVNDQIVDSVIDVVTLTGGAAPGQSLSMIDAVMAETLGMAMYNAVSRQQGAGMIGSAATTATCARMIGAPFPLPAPPTPAPAPGPVPAPGNDLAAIAAETEKARQAIDFLNVQAKGVSFEAGYARSSLNQLVAEAAPPVPPSPTPPSPSPPPPPPPPPAPSPPPPPAPSPPPPPAPSPPPPPPPPPPSPGGDSSD